jgi:hypothetical protein
MNTKRLLKVVLEFISRLIMNAFKLAIGFGLGYASLHASKIIVSQDAVIALGFFAVLLSAFETWQDWEIVPEAKAAPDAEHNHTVA